MLVAVVLSACGGSSAEGDDGGDDVEVPPGIGDGPAVGRGSQFLGTPERFNRYYTDPDWSPRVVIHASPSGGGDGSSADSPTTLEEAAAQVEPGTRVEIAAGTYEDVCLELGSEQSGTYQQPIVFAGQLADDGSLQARLECCDNGRASCFNLEAADYVAIDSVEVVGGEYGVRAVGADFAADQHQVGVAILRSSGHDQENDPFFSGQSDWFVVESVIAHDAGSGDGHGIYLSNGSDWLIVRGNELYSNESSDLQINADPLFTCDEYDSAECDAVAGTHPTGGRGASDFALVERNYFHDGAAQGANFTSVRNSIVRNNVFAVYERHGVSFWQETDNPRLGSRDNRILHNLFVTVHDGHAVQFINSSTDNVFAQNVLLGVSLADSPQANPDALLLEVDDTVGGNQYRRNAYVAGRIDGREPGDDELVLDDLDAGWFAGFPTVLQHAIDGYAPMPVAPWAAAGELLDDAPGDMFGAARTDPTALGPLSP
jgi:Right handed beta helix region